MGYVTIRLGLLSQTKTAKRSNRTPVKRKNLVLGSLQKVQGHRAGVNADLTPSTGGPVGHACR